LCRYKAFIVFEVIHLLPCDGVGGVEMAANTMKSLREESCHFKVEYAFPGFYDSGSRKVYNPLFLVLAARHIIKANPDVLVVSLWRSCIVALIVKALRPSVKLVTFLHSAEDVHIVDRIATVAAVKMSDEVWADSRQTLKKRLDGIQYGTGRVISFVTRRIVPLEKRKVEPVFIYWGRINQQKQLGRALRIFDAIRLKQPFARYVVIGPDGGALDEMRALCTSLGLDHSVKFVGSCSFQEIQRYASEASFYLQTSLVEGMAMSVVEAMQLGLVPIVTPVGEIEQYARHGENAVVVTDDDKVCADVLALLHDEERYQNMRQQAIDTWLNQPLYKDSVLSACRDLLGMERIR